MTYYDNSTTPRESSEMRHQAGTAMNWTSEEQAILSDGLARYSLEPTISRYAKIASRLQNKTIRDVALRCKWIYKKESNKRRKEDHNGSRKARVDNKEIIDMVVASNLAPHLLPREEDGITYELLKQNEQLFNQISANLTSSRLTENSILFYKIRGNIRELLKNLNENVPETMKHMPQLPEKLNDDLLDSFLPPTDLPMLL
ncbi:unnamed protein product [Microthlaspi erraticum]|uniref:Myb-like domain-containing protein n=1 Tax=Microthlaspi erraticum TaxID=1685480 RepID=A0A6D2KBM7_9BRAS|nr:unnamed protein product [Microthlaspi erraticum]